MLVHYSKYDLVLMVYKFTVHCIVYSSLYSLQQIVVTYTRYNKLVYVDCSCNHILLALSSICHSCDFQRGLFHKYYWFVWLQWGLSHILAYMCKLLCLHANRHLAVTILKNILYSVKLSREKTFVNWWKIQFLQRKLSPIARFCSTKGATPPNFMEKTFANSHKTAKFVKVFSLKGFLLYSRRKHQSCPPTFANFLSVTVQYLVLNQANPTSQNSITNTHAKLHTCVFHLASPS